MTIARRTLIASALLGTALPGWTAPSAPQEGRHFRRLGSPLAVSNPQGEVLEFFWYGCPHCLALEPSIAQWRARKPAAVSFKRSAAVIGGFSKPHQRIFFTLDAMGLADSLHDKVFNAIQVERQDLQELTQIQASLARFGVDPVKFAATYQSFGVQTKCQQANALFKPFENGGVPQLVVNGRYLTSPPAAGGEAQALQVVDHLLGLPVA